VTGWTIGEVCAGTGMLSGALGIAFGADLSWYAELDQHASVVAAARHPGLANYGDIKAMPWEDIPPVDILCGGIPCQGASQAGKRKGVDDDRWLWPFFADGISRLRRPPSVVVIENVPGLLTVNKGGAFAQVVSGLAAFGYVGAYGVYSAAEAGAPHLRKRLFVIAAHRRGYGRAILEGAVALAADAHRQPGLEWRVAGAIEAAGGRPRADARRPGGAPAADGDGDGREVVVRLESGVGAQRDADGRGAEDGNVALLPTPMASARAKSARALTASTGNGRRDGGGQSSSLGLDEIAPMMAGVRPDHLPPDDQLPPASLAIVHALLPTPTSALGLGGNLSRSGDRKGEQLLGGLVKSFIPAGQAADEKRLPTPNARDWKGGNVPVGRARGDGRVRTAGDSDLPTAMEMLAGGQPLLATPRVQSGGAAGNASKDGKGQSLASDVLALLPTPTKENSHGNTARSDGTLLLPGVAESMALLPTPLSGEARHGSPGQHRSRGDTMLTGEVLALASQAEIEWDWREYGPAVRRWEAVRGMAAPPPVEPGKGGKPRLAAPFAEWMMGMPWIGVDCDGPGPEGGWVTGVPGLARSAQLKIIGNGVVWRQMLMAAWALAPTVLGEMG
jgi:DNA (cytosine-5)-methyltransferase 1